MSEGGWGRVTKIRRDNSGEVGGSGGGGDSGGGGCDGDGSYMSDGGGDGSERICYCHPKTMGVGSAVSWCLMEEEEEEEEVMVVVVVMMM